MKRYVNLTLLSLVLALFQNGCTNEEVLSSKQNNHPITFVAQQEGFTANASRSVIYDGSEAGENYVFMQWAPLDQIGVISIDGSTGNIRDNNSPFTNAEAQNANKAQFQGTLGYFTPSCKIYAYYPYAEGTCTKTINAPIDQHYEYKNFSSLAKYDHKVAENVAYSPDQYPSSTSSTPYEVTGTFKQLTTLLQFNVNLTEVSSMIKKNKAEANLTDCSLQRVKISVKDSETNEYVALTGAFTYEVTQADQGLLLTGFDPKKENSLTIDLAEKPSLSQERFRFYAIVAPGKTLNKKLTCNLEVGNASVTYTLQFAAKVMKNFEAGRFYQVDINEVTFQKAVAYAPTEVKVEEKIQQEEETANCYMISMVGEHQFNANVIGNGQKGIIPNAGFHTETAAIHPVSAKLLWQDTENFISNVQLQSNGWVKYQANKNVGNAVIAVYDGVNATGKVLWSWHIWGVGDEPVQDEVITNRAGYSFTLMDRTLGAHSKSSVTATLYQWGRKDPFPNASVYYPGEGASAVDIQQSFPVLKSGQPHPVTDLVQHPDHLMNAGGSPYVEVNKLFWGDGNTADRYDFGEYPDYGGYYVNAQADNRWLHVKTIYDPSPVGYRVANRYTFTGFIKIHTAVTSSCEEVNARFAEGELYELEFANGYYFLRNEKDKTGIFFPLCGRRTTSDGNMLSYPYNDPKNTTYGQEGYYWTSGYGKYEEQYEAPLFSFYQPTNLKDIDKGYTPKYNTFNACDISGFSGMGACAVRCVREDNNLVVNK